MGRYPQILLIALVACGTRAVIDAVFGARRDGGETGLAKHLASSLRTGMIVLLDRGFATNAFLEMVAGTQAANSTKPDRRVTSQLHRACVATALSTPLRTEVGAPATCAAVPGN